MRIILSLFTILIFSNCSNSKPITGYWTGSMEMNGKTVDISIVFNPDSPSFSSNDLMIFEQPVMELKINGNEILFSIDLETVFRFDGALENGKIAGTVKMQDGPPDMKIKFNLTKKSETPPAKAYSIEEVVVKSKGVNLSAEIFKPNTSKPHPAMILLHGSSTNLKNQYRFYADFFAKIGFEVLIFDKRGNGKSTGNYTSASYNDLTDDAVACLETMKKRGSVDKTKIGLWGFSQGATLLPLIVTKTDIPAFLIAKSPEVVSIAEGAAFSDSMRVVNAGNSSANGHVAAESHRQVEKMIRNGSSSREVENYINQIAQKNSFMNQTGLYGNITIPKEEYEGYYWKGRIVNFYSYWKSLNIPTLVLMGEDDEFLNSIKNETLINNLHNAKIETKLFQRANHSLKKAFNPVKYPDFDWPRVADGYLEFVKNWIGKNVYKP